MASRSAMLGSACLRVACDEIIAKGKKLAAHIMEAADIDIEFGDGMYRVVGTDRALGIVEVARRAYAIVGMPREFGIGLEAVGAYDSDPPSFPNGCHAAEVEVDPDTGAVTLARFAVVDDVGRALNPLLLAGQIHGAVAQGIGQALMEHVVCDPSTGQNLCASLMDYAMPRAGDMPSFAVGSRRPVNLQPARRQGCGRSRLRRRTAGNRQRYPRRTGALRRHIARDASDTASGVARDPRRAHRRHRRERGGDC
jgi:carbon-monoxide dehydrogenase large subunit